MYKPKNNLVLHRDNLCNQTFFIHTCIFFQSFYCLCHGKDSSLHVGEITSSSARKGMYSEIFFNCTLTGIKAPEIFYINLFKFH